MKHRFISLALTTAALLLGSHLALASETLAAAPQATASKAKVSTKTTKSAVAAKPKVAAKVKLVDINSASVAELKKLPGVTDAEAAKIIAGRPYGSKAWLVSHKIIDAGVYVDIKQLIIA